MTIQIKKAVREHVYLKLGVTGPAGSGKTQGGIGLAMGLAPNRKVAVIDTENRSASYYAGMFDFDVVELDAPFTTQKYLEALNEIIKAGYEVVVIDSLTHEWAASGGILDAKAQKDARGGNSFANWGEMKVLHNKFVESLLQSHIHVVCTLRSKMEYVLEQDEKGKATPRKVGMAPISSDGMEYEFGVVFDVERATHLAVASKDRTGLFEGRSLNLNEEVGKELAAWLATGAAPTPVAQASLAAARPTQAPEPAANPAPTAPSSQPAPAAATPQAPPASPGRRTRTQPAAAAQPAAPSGSDFSSHPDWEPFVEAMGELAQVSVGMPAQTRNALCGQFDKEGPASLAALRAEIASIKSVLSPEASGGAFVGMTPPAKGPVSQEAADFVDGMADGPESPDTDEAAGGISRDQYALLNRLINAHGINRDSLRVYCSKLSQLLPGANGPTLARMTAQAFTKLREDLQNTSPAANGKTWCQVRIDRINATPATPFNPAQAAS